MYCSEADRDIHGRVKEGIKGRSFLPLNPFLICKHSRLYAAYLDFDLSLESQPSPLPTRIRETLNRWIVDTGQVQHDNNLAF